MNTLFSIVAALGAIVLGLILFCIALSIVSVLVLVGVGVYICCKESREMKKNGK